MTLSRRALLLSGLGMLVGCAGPHYRGPDRTLTVAAGERGGFYLAFAELLATEINASEPHLRCTAVPTDASVTNLRRLRDGGADLALTLADAAQAAFSGHDPFTEPLPLRALGRVYENYLQLVVRANGPVRCFNDLAGRTMSLGAPGSGAAVTGARLIDTAALQIRQQHLPLDEAISALRTGLIDALLWSGGVPTPALVRLAEELPLALLAVDTVVPVLRHRYGPVYEQVRVPAGAYRNAREVPTIGVANLLVCAPSLPDDVAAAVVGVLVNRAANLVPAQALGAQFLDPRTLIGTETIELHPGAAAAYRALHG